MKISELKAAIANLPDDVEVLGKLEGGAQGLELRDLFNSIEKTFERTVAVFGNSYGYGYPHLTDEHRAKTRHAILDGLADVLRVEKWATRRFTSVHGDWRIYSAHGGQNDTCYGTGYDPRVWRELEAEGLIVREELDHFGGLQFRLTDAGKQQVEIKRLA